MKPISNRPGHPIQLRFPAGSLAIAAAALLPAGAKAQPARWKREGWSRTDFTKSRADFSEFISGGPPKDGIPSIDRPAFAKIAQIRDLSGRDPVLSVTHNGDARAYPLRVLIWHEIVNDVVGGRPMTITYCPLCNSGIVFDRRVDGRVLDFGVTGKLRNSDLVMYDRQTESWWQQFTGEAIVGTLSGKKLKMAPARLESFAEFRRRHPEGKVLIPNSRNRPYGMNPYAGYDTSKKPFLYRGDMPDGIEPLARVVVVRRPGRKPLVVSLALLRQKRVFERDGVVLRWQTGQASALDTNVIAQGRDVGTVTAQTQGAGGAPTDVNYDVTFAFVAHAFHKDAPIIMK